MDLNLLKLYSYGFELDYTRKNVHFFLYITSWFSVDHSVFSNYVNVVKTISWIQFYAVITTKCLHIWESKRVFKQKLVGNFEIWIFFQQTFRHGKQLNQCAYCVILHAHLGQRSILWPFHCCIFQEAKITRHFFII